MASEDKPAEGTSPNDIQTEKLTEKPKGPARKRRILIFLLVSLFNAGLLVLLGSQLLVPAPGQSHSRSEEHTSELQSHSDLVCRLLLEKKKNNKRPPSMPSVATLASL